MPCAVTLFPSTDGRPAFLVQAFSVFYVHHSRRETPSFGAGRDRRILARSPLVLYVCL